MRNSIGHPTSMVTIRKGSDGGWWVYRLSRSGRVELLDGRGEWQECKEGELNINPTIASPSFPEAEQKL